MNKHSRTANSTINFAVNIIYQFVIIILAFFSRRVFIESLGVEFLGINGLFTNIITVLSLSELGVGAAIHYSMYKEIADGNKERLKALTTYYKTLYNRIALIVFIVGIAILPFLRFIINLEKNIDHIELYYLISLLGTVSSYLFVYKTSIVSADQSEYKIKSINMIIRFLITVLQIVSLVVFKNYFIFIVIELLLGIIGNFICAKLAEKWYPFIKENAELSKAEKKEIWTNIKAMFVYKVSCVFLNNTDNIIISVIVGTNYVGYNSNYYMISNKINAIINMLFGAIRPSIGNFNAQAPAKEQYGLFKNVSFMAYWLYSFATIGVFFCGEDFIRIITASNSFVLGFPIILATSLNLYVGVLKSAIGMYRETTGLFKLSKYVIFVSSIINIVLSIILGNIYGLFGVLIATFISRLVCDVWYEPYIMFKKMFNVSPKEFYLCQVKYAILTIILVAILYPLISFITIDNLYFRIILKFIVCTLIVNTIYLILYHKNEQFIYLKNKIITILKAIFSKVATKESN